MSQPPRPAPSHVPTLTEVIEIPEALPTPAHPVTSAVEALTSEPVSTWMAPAVVDSVQPAQTVDIPAPPAPVAAPAPVPLAMPPAMPAATALVASPTAPVSVPEPLPIPASLLKPALAPLPPLPSPTPVPPARTASVVDEAAMAQRVLSEVQRQIDGMLEYRLREALTPILARTSESLVRELRQELSKTMRDVVSRAVAQEVARQRSRS
jgi:hypothetical protein